MMLHPEANTFGLPPCLHIPIAARDVEAILEYVGTITDRVDARDGRINALCIQPYNRAAVKDPRRYRAAYLGFGLPPLSEQDVLDHVHNRHATRLRGYLHPYLRLCPVSRAVNTSGGVDAGGEGMEKAYLRSLAAKVTPDDGLLAQFARRPVVYADPMDITKMLDIPPGTQVLNGVRDTLALLYPPEP